MSKTTIMYSPEVRARAVRPVLDHEAEHPSRWAAVSSVAAKIGCAAHTLHGASSTLTTAIDPEIEVETDNDEERVEPRWVEAGLPAPSGDAGGDIIRSRLDLCP